VKTGYSLLLGEYVEAEVLEYHDCEHWQIVCPACKEPLFKCRRETPFVTHYLSHYGKDKAYVDECELRAKSITETHINQVNVFSRGQKLKYFLNVFSDMVKDCLWSGQCNWAEETRKVSRQSKALRKLKVYTHSYCKKKFCHHYDVEAVFYHYEMEHKSIGCNLKTTFSNEMQVRIAADFWDYVIKTKSTFAFDFLFNNAWVLKAETVRSTSLPALTEADRKYIAETDGPVLLGVPSTGLNGALVLLSELENKNSCLINDNHNDLMAFGECLAEYMIRILCRIDYKKWLLKAAECPR